MKRFLASLFAVAILLSACMSVGCARSASTPAEAAETAAAQTEADAQEAQPDYDNMSMDELYALAKQETGKITIYATTATAQVAVKKFVKSFPEFDGRIEYIESDTDTVADRIETETDTGNINADILQVKDCSGEIYYELVKYDYLDVFYPASVAEHVDSDLLQYGLPVYVTCCPWFYNTKAYPDGSPLTSWWDIVKGYDTTTCSYVDANEIYPKNRTQENMAIQNRTVKSI